ncbi:MAG: calcium-binding protein [Thermodesulfobacteriota bacterium]|nr:calcium-binding protein [Thermodesulfobacteriota bacterium]
MKKSLIFTLIVFFLMSLNVLFLTFESEARNVERVSVNIVGLQGDGYSYRPSISSDGRYVAFESDAANLVAGDTNARKDVFVYDRDTYTIERVSVDNSGVQGDGSSSFPSISSDGRYVAFESDATNLVTGDTNNCFDMFVYDRDTDTIERVSVDNSGVQGNTDSYRPSISPDGRYVAFQSWATNLVTGDTNGTGDVFVYDRDTDTIERVSVDNSGVQGDGYSYHPSISSDGRYVAFASDATNLVTGDTNNSSDMFVYDRDTDTIERVSVDNSGGQGDGFSYGPSISSDGRYVAFHSIATNLVNGDTNSSDDVFVYDRDTDTIERVSVDNSGMQGNSASYESSISSDGRYVAFTSRSTNLVAGDTNASDDAFVYDRGTDTIERVSVDNSGGQGDGFSYESSISPDGHYVAFHSDATNLVTGDTNGTGDVFVYDRGTDTIERVSVDKSSAQGNGDSEKSSISSDGRYVAFESTASNLVTGDTNGTDDVFVYDRDTDTIERVSVDNSGVQGDGSSWYPSISSDGRYVAFRSTATNLVTGDTNGSADVFVYDRDTDTIERVSVDNSGVQGDSFSYGPSISPDGRYVAFESDATNLVAGDTNTSRDVFVYDRDTDTIERVSVDNSGVQGDGNSYHPSISSDGRYVAFDSTATNLVTEDTNGNWDVFVSYTQTGTSSPPGGGGGGGGGGCYISTCSTLE